MRIDSTEVTVSRITAKAKCSASIFGGNSAGSVVHFQAMVAASNVRA